MDMKTEVIKLFKENPSVLICTIGGVLMGAMVGAFFYFNGLLG